MSFNKSLHSLEEQSKQPRHHEDNSIFNTIIGIIVFYVGIVLFGLTGIYQIGSFGLFLTVLSNVDLIAETLSFSIPKYFHNIYDLEQSTLTGFIS